MTPPEKDPLVRATQWAGFVAAASVAAVVVTGSIKIIIWMLK